MLIITIVIVAILMWLVGVVMFESPRELPLQAEDIPIIIEPPKQDIQQAISKYLADRAVVTDAFHTRRREIATQYHADRLIMSENQAWVIQFQAGRELDERFYTDLLRIEREYDAATR
jgi:hypothetical protein